MTTNGDRTPVLSRSTLVPLGMVIGAASTVFAAGFYVAKLSAQQEKIDARLQSIEIMINRGMTHEEFEAWVRLARAMNGAKVDFPEPIRR